MNIREHIEAGHYPTDDKGRALVPMRNGKTATIFGTDFSDYYPLAGRYFIYDQRPFLGTWRADGQAGCDGPGRNDLLPPPPRKVKVTAKLRHTPTGWVVEEVVRERGGEIPQSLFLADEYEEPWP